MIQPVDQKSKLHFCGILNVARAFQMVIPFIDRETVKAVMSQTFGKTTVRTFDKCYLDSSNVKVNETSIYICTDLV